LDCELLLLLNRSGTMTLLPLNLSTEARQSCCSYLSVVFFIYILVGLSYLFVGAYVQQSIMSFGSVVYERYSSAYPDFMIAVGTILIGVHLFGTKVGPNVFRLKIKRYSCTLEHIKMLLTLLLFITFHPLVVSNVSRIIQKGWV